MSETIDQLRAELEKCQCEVQQLKGFEVVLKEICDIAIEPPNTNEGVKDAVQRIKNERDAAKDHAKASIDYQCFALRENIGPLDGKGCVQNLDVDKAMSVLAHNELLGLRWHLDSETPKGYKRSTQIYIDSEDMQKLRNQPKREELEKCQADCASMRGVLEDLSAVVQGESPSLLEEGTGGSEPLKLLVKKALSTTSGQSILDRLHKLEAERSEMCRWFERHHVTGDLSLEEVDAMTPKQMADYAYERVAEKLEAWEVKWRPIHTAPKDGAHILVCSRNGAQVQVCRWAWERWMSVPGDYNRNPEFWMPLPPFTKSCIGGAK